MNTLFTAAVNPRSISYRPKQASIEGLIDISLAYQFQAYVSCLVPYMGPIVSVVTLQDQQNLFKKSRPISYSL